jgi:hypothetical protein
VCFVSQSTCISFLLLVQVFACQMSLSKIPTGLTNVNRRWIRVLLPTPEPLFSVVVSHKLVASGVCFQAWGVVGDVIRDLLPIDVEIMRATVSCISALEADVQRLTLSASRLSRVVVEVDVPWHNGTIHLGKGAEGGGSGDEENIGEAQAENLDKRLSVHLGGGHLGFLMCQLLHSDIVPGDCAVAEVKAGQVVLQARVQGRNVDENQLRIWILFRLDRGT